MAQQPDALTTTPSSSDPEELRRDIARTRADMGTTVDAIEDRVSPRRIRERQADRLRSRFRGAREAVMGSPVYGDSPSRMTEGTSRARDMVGEAPTRATQATRGNPLAAGLVAFGVGAVAGSLMPPSELERRTGAQVRDTIGEPVTEQVKQVGQDMKGSLQEEARRAGDEVRQTAQQATSDVKDTTSNDRT